MTPELVLCSECGPLMFRSDSPWHWWAHRVGCPGLREDPAVRYWRLRLMELTP